MNDDLNNTLRSAKVPGRSAGYWEAFPRRVTAQLGQAERPAATVRWAAWGWTAATACVLVVATLVGWRLWPVKVPPTNYAKLAREIAAEFPGQLRAIVVDEHGFRVELADTPTVPVSSPVLVEVCRAQGCRRVITFSGQEIKVNGEPWDVLVNGDGRVIVAGRSTGNYRIQGSVL
jgi:hypothetical protein